MIPKFKAWDNENKCWTNYAITDDLQIFYDKYTGCWHRKNKDRFVLVQSTGLKDKNGAEIYEGDIVKAVAFLKWIGIVKYDTEKAAFMLDGVNDTHTRDNYVYMSQFDDDFEILGNIYENPELMEV